MLRHAVSACTYRRVPGKRRAATEATRSGTTRSRAEPRANLAAADARVGSQPRSAYLSGVGRDVRVPVRDARLSARSTVAVFGRGVAQRCPSQPGHSACLAWRR
jgi:hypothetical protein